VGLRLLYQAYREAAATGAQVRLAASHPAVLRVLKLIGFHHVLPIYSTAVQALAAPPVG
jgi:anti-anti-sigma factor